MRTAGAITLFRVRGIPVEFHFTFLFLAFWILMVSFQDGGRRDFFWPAIIASVFLHELGHAFAALHFGVPIYSIVMYAFGGLTRFAEIAPVQQDLWITAAGPAVNLALALAAAPFILTDGTSGLAGDIAAANVSLFLFNMIPAYPLDGGRILRALLAMRLPEQQATRITGWTGVVLGALIGLYAFARGEMFLIFIAAMILSSAWQMASASR